MNLTKTEIVLYTALAVGTFFALMMGVPQWMIWVGALVIVVILVALPSRKQPAAPAPEDETGTPPKRVRWNRVLVLALIVVLGIALRLVDTPWLAIVLICGFLLGGYGLHLFGHRPAMELLGRTPDAAPRRAYHGPTVGEWAQVLLCAVFCLGAIVTWQMDWRGALTALAFFGGGLWLSLATVVRKMRERRFTARQVAIAANVNIPAAGEQLYAIAIGLIVVGGIIWFVDPKTPWLIRGIGAFMAIVGLVLVLLRVSGLYRRAYLRFDADGIVFGQARLRFRVAWNNIAELGAGEYASNPVVFVQVVDVDAIDVDPVGARPKLARQIANNRALMGADLIIMPGTYGLDAPPLLAALLRYAHDPASRDELNQAPKRITRDSA